MNKTTKCLTTLLLAGGLFFSTKSCTSFNKDRTRNVGIQNAQYLLDLLGKSEKGCEEWIRNSLSSGGTAHYPTKTVSLQTGDYIIKDEKKLRIITTSPEDWVNKLPDILNPSLDISTETYQEIIRRVRTCILTDSELLQIMNAVEKRRDRLNENQ